MFNKPVSLAVTILGTTVFAWMAACSSSKETANNSSSNTGGATSSSSSTSLGSGTSSSSTGSSTSGGNSASTLIDDAANPSGQISLRPTGGYTAGYWFTTINDTGGTITPEPAASGGSWSYTTVPSPADASITMAACISGTPSPTLYSEAGEGFNWALEPIDAAADSGVQAAAVQYDISAYTGISFWAYVPPSSPAGTQMVRVLFPDKTSDPRGGVCSLDASTTPCSPDTAQCMVCYDSWEDTPTFNPGWQFVRIEFSELVQLMFGEIEASFDAQHSYGVTFQANGPQQADAGAVPFDFCIADINFITN